jgi:ubiquinone/menaquinone biosynthesis C-methylase UbiE
MGEVITDMTIYSDFNEYVDRYDRWYEINRLAYLSEVSALKCIVQQKGLGLEIGVGTGRFASVLDTEYGIDLAKRSVKIAKTRGIIVLLATGEDLPFKDESFDYVLMVITLSFFKKPKRVITEVYRILKQKGRLIIGFVDKNSFLGEVYKKRKDKGYPFFREVINFLSPIEVINLLRDCRFKNFEIYQTLFQLPKKIQVIQKAIKGHGKGGFVVIGTEKSNINTQKEI